MLTREEFEKGIQQITEEFNLKNPKVTKFGMDEPELTYVYTANIESKEASVYIHTDVRRVDNNKPVIYCNMYYQNEFGLTQFQSNRSFPYFSGLIFFPDGYLLLFMNSIIKKKKTKLISFLEIGQ